MKSFANLGIPSIVLMVALVAGCDSTSVLEQGTAPVTIFLDVVAPSSSVSGKSSGTDNLVLSGNNGTLTITELRFILDEFELEMTDGACADSASTQGENDDVEEGEHADDECAEFEVGPLFVTAPLTDVGIELLATQIPLGEYKKIEFEIDDLDLDDDEDASPNTRLIDEVRGFFPDWPDDASIVLVGEFAPSDSSVARPFTVYLGAEIEMEFDLDPPLAVTSEGVSEALTIALDPIRWISLIGDDVPDLSAYDYGRTGTVIEFELELGSGNGFGVHAGHDDD